MTVWHIFSIELAVGIALILLYGFANEHFVRLENAVVRFVKRLLHR